jgi:hypothetical protein
LAIARILSTAFLDDIDTERERIYDIGEEELNASCRAVILDVHEVSFAI